MQVDPIKPTVKASGTKRLKLICDGPLSNFAFKFTLRRYTLDSGVLGDRNDDDYNSDIEGRCFHSLTSELNLRTFGTHCSR